MSGPAAEAWKQARRASFNMKEDAEYREERDGWEDEERCRRIEQRVAPAISCAHSCFVSQGPVPGTGSVQKGMRRTATPCHANHHYAQCSAAQHTDVLACSLFSTAPEP
jgi:hypothetical protein